MTHLVVSRTDAIGDLVLSLPLAYLAKTMLGYDRVTFLASDYAAPVARYCRDVDAVVPVAPGPLPVAEKTRMLAALQADAIVHLRPDAGWAQAACRAGIGLRIGTSHRWYHWLTCNRLPSIGRARSDRHEAQLNADVLFAGHRRSDRLTREALTDALRLDAPAGAEAVRARLGLAAGQRYAILHARSRGHGREWPLGHFIRLAQSLVARGVVPVATGVAAEHDILAPLAGHEGVVDAVGKLTFDEFAALVAGAEAMVAAGTGPLHLAGALGVHAIGLFPPRRPIFPTRWAPLGRRSLALTARDTCARPACDAQDCACMRDITVDRVCAALERTA